MNHQILDRATAPTNALEIAQLTGCGWAIYIGGPGLSAGEVNTWADVAPELSELPRLWIYGGGQTNFSALAGEVEGADAVMRCAARFSIPAGATIFLDLEAGPARSDLQGAIEKVQSWVSTLHSAGHRAGVYSSPDVLTALATATPVPDAVWCGSWIATEIDDGLDLANITGLEPGLWDGPGQRAWQYAGSYGGKTCVVSGLNVDVSLADEGVLSVPSPAISAPPAPPATPVQSEPLPSPVPPEAPPTPKTYVVQEGDTLIGIAEKFGVVPWQLLYSDNVSIIEAAAHSRGFRDSGGGHLIFPGTTLVIP